MKRRVADAGAVDRVPFVDRGFVAAVGALVDANHRAEADEPLRRGSSLSCGEALELFRSQLESRHLDLCARALKKRGASFYTIGSSGHEGNAAVAAALRPSDPALLHYRSGAFFLQRARQAGYERGIYDVLLGLCASAEEPIAGGRHKVFGSVPLAIPPQTSTIASHLPKAVGMAFALERAARLKLRAAAPPDAIVLCSFGDASVNHSTAQGAFNAASWSSFQGLPLPLLFLCEDNGIGISVPTPRGWIAQSFANRPALRYFAADGLDLAAAYDGAREAADWVRRERRPAFLHLRTVRLLGHAGSDIETGYRELDDIEANEALDPLIASARLLVESGAARRNELCELYERTRARVAEQGERAVRAPKLSDARAVMRPLALPLAEDVAREAARPTDAAARERVWNGKLPEHDKPAPLGVHINRALGDLLARYPEACLFGEDVGHKGGVYAVTRELWRRVERGRVFDTLLDEQTILGLAIGMGQMGLLPLPEIQYLAYLHNAEDQLRGEAASLQFFSSGQCQNPMVVRIAGYAYQKGFGGHFHNDHSVAVLRDIPGLVIASPARGDDAAAMLRTCAAAARVGGSVCVFLEPIALYPQRDLHEPGDGLWCTPYEAEPAHVPIGAARVWLDGRANGATADLLIVTWANGLWMSLRAAKRLESDGIRCRVLDLRWLAPLPIEDVLREAASAGRVLVVDETRRTGGVGEAIVTALSEGGYAGKLRRLAAEDSFVPLGDAANLVLVQEADIERAARELVGAKHERALVST